MEPQSQSPFELQKEQDKALFYKTKKELYAMSAAGAIFFSLAVVNFLVTKQLDLFDIGAGFLAAICKIITNEQAIYLTELRQWYLNHRE